jgi:hypothetical protein
VRSLARASPRLWKGSASSPGAVTMALELVPDLFLSCLPRLVPGFHRAGKELIGMRRLVLRGVAATTPCTCD